MILQWTEPAEVADRELAEIVEQLHKLSADSYDMLDRNYSGIAKLLRKAMKLAKREEEWLTYFEGLHDYIYHSRRVDENMEVVKYAEVFYRDCELYLEKAVAGRGGKEIGQLSTWIYDMIFDVYWRSHQIDDAKMEAFMKLYEENALKFGVAVYYYQGEMEFSILYSDTELARHGAEYFGKYEEQMRSCYVCGHKQFIGCYLMTGKRQKAEELMLQLINRDIPRQHLWCYDMCQMAETHSMYADVLEDCLWLGKVEDFGYFYEKYWSEQPREQWRGLPDRWERTLSAYLCAIAGNFDELEQDVQQAEKDMQDYGKKCTMDIITQGLMWKCYFTLLDRSGVHEVETSLAAAEENGRSGETRQGAADGAEKEQRGSSEDKRKVSCLALSRYFGAMADTYGAKFQAARKKFDYERLKKSYETCAGVG